jgi:hypothetical protein
MNDKKVKKHKLDNVVPLDYEMDDDHKDTKTKHTKLDPSSTGNTPSSNTANTTIFKDKIYIINVEGHIIHVYGFVLKQMSYFEAIVAYHKDNTDFSKDVIDRDYEHFRYLHNCLRDHKYIDDNRLVQLEPDIIFFDIKYLLARIQQHKEALQLPQNQKVPTITPLHIYDCRYELRENTLKLFLPSQYKDDTISLERTFACNIKIHIPDGYVGYIQSLLPNYTIHNNILMPTTTGHNDDSRFNPYNKRERLTPHFLFKLESIVITSNHVHPGFKLYIDKPIVQIVFMKTECIQQVAFCPKNYFARSNHPDVIGMFN